MAVKRVRENEKANVSESKKKPRESFLRQVFLTNILLGYSNHIVQFDKKCLAHYFASKIGVRYRLLKKIGI
jgi:hypothetical protein